MSRRIYFLLAFAMIIIALAHVFAFEKLNARSASGKFDILGE